MKQESATKVFESLSSGIRLNIFRLLVRQGPEGMVAGQISAALDLPPNNVSFHLKGMVYASLLSVRQEGRFQRYEANLRLINELIQYLTEECCAGHPEQCAELVCKPQCAEPGLGADIS